MEMVRILRKSNKRGRFMEEEKPLSMKNLLS